MEYQATFDDGCVLTFEETTQRGALGFISDHAQPDHEVTLKSRRSTRLVNGLVTRIEEEARIPWDRIDRSSFWKVEYPGNPNCVRRIR